MKRDEAQFDKIERYLRGELSEEENLAMERAIAEDSDLAEEIEFQQLELDAMELILEDKLRGKMESWKQSPPPPPKGGNGGFRFWIAGVLVLGLIAFGVWFLQPEPTTPPKTDPIAPTEPTKDKIKDKSKDKTKPPVAIEDQTKDPIKDPIKDAIKIPKIDIASTSLAMNTYDLPEDLKGALKSPEEGTTSPLDPGLKAFSIENYRKAVVEFNKIKPAAGEEVYLRAQELLGHAYFLNKQYPQAAKVFSILAQNQDYNTLRQDAEWYLVLSLLPNYSKNKVQIETLLNPMLEPANFHNHGAQAVDLQKELKELK
ncbi:MAG TPA: hypothetical protein PLC89_19240 [Haliscomenobacter sp.]|uniref:hypothetical protein n=1 Tax=Haliscomenobacter sp. TaxID=2717303 RepID=UPI002B715174|nr:hypothetical protein [Haliscomenobacter sp.]HOY19453.1 hypothetical protein [Haliscomenobacter sp.]